MAQIEKARKDLDKQFEQRMKDQQNKYESQMKQIRDQAKELEKKEIK